MRSSVSINLYNKCAIQIYWPKIFKSSFGYGIQLKTTFVIGYQTIAFEILGFGIGICRCQTLGTSHSLGNADFKIGVK